jgi:hypothetical protein
MRENSEQMECVGMSGVGLQDLCVELFGFDETSALMAAHGGRKQLPNVRRFILHGSLS